jgi:hypothetical protein
MHSTLLLLLFWLLHEWKAASKARDEKNAPICIEGSLKKSRSFFSILKDLTWELLGCQKELHIEVLLSWKSFNTIEIFFLPRDLCVIDNTSCEGLVLYPLQKNGKEKTECREKSSQEA